MTYKLVVADPDDLESGALCACKEARGDGRDACTAVIFIELNRAAAWKKSIHDVVYGKNQFSSMSVPSDPEFNWEPETPADVAAMDMCRQIMRDAVNGQLQDPTNGALYYDNPKTAKSPWFAKVIVNDPIAHPLRAVIGKQNFYA